jgi:hypothetical protein
MRRFAFLIATLACLITAGCAEGPVEPRTAAPSGAPVSVQNDTTQVPPPAGSRDNGIGMGSGT